MAVSWKHLPWAPQVWFTHHIVPKAESPIASERICWVRFTQTELWWRYLCLCVAMAHSFNGIHMKTNDCSIKGLQNPQQKDDTQKNTGCMIFTLHLFSGVWEVLRQYNCCCSSGWNLLQVMLQEELRAKGLRFWGWSRDSEHGQGPGYHPRRVSTTR